MGLGFSWGEASENKDEWKRTRKVRTQRRRRRRTRRRRRRRKSAPALQKTKLLGLLSTLPLYSLEMKSDHLIIFTNLIRIILNKNILIKITLTIIDIGKNIPNQITPTLHCKC